MAGHSKWVNIRYRKDEYSKAEMPEQSNGA